MPCRFFYLHIVPEAYRERLAENLHKIIAANDYSLDFGFIGSVMVPDVLAETGYAETAYRMLTKTTLPSWGYWIKRNRGDFFVRNLGRDPPYREMRL